MAFIPVPNVAEAVLVFSNDTELSENTLYFDAGGEPTLGDLGLLGSALSSWWQTSVAPNVCNAVVLNEIICTDLGIQAGAQVTTPVNQTGGISTEMAPTNVAPAISFRTGFRGRAFRGRNYIVGVPNASIAINTLDGGWMASMVAAYEELLPGGGVALPGLYTWSVVSRFSGVDPVTHKPIPRSTGIFTHVLTVGFTDNVVDSQRRRLPGRGR